MGPHVNTFRPGGCCRFNCRIGLVCALICLPVWVLALDIPFFAEFHSDNRRTEWLDRPGSEIVWNEKYQIALGVDSLRRGDLCFDLRLASRANFCEQQILIDRAALALRLNDFKITALTRPQGVAKGYFHQQLWLAGPDFNRYQYAQTRFNGLELRYTASDWQPAVAIGGNVHTQAAGYLGCQGKVGAADLDLRLDAISRDPHWNLPLIQPSFSLSISHSRLVLRTDAAVKHLFADGGKRSRDEWFAAAELQWKLFPKISAVLGGSYLDQDYAPRDKAGLDLAVRYASERWALTPAINWDRVDGDGLWKASLLGDLKLGEYGTLGLYGSYDRSKTRQSSFTVGLQSSLRADF